MKIYVASSLLNNENAVNLMFDLVHRGHIITYDWTLNARRELAGGHFDETILNGIAEEELRGVSTAAAVVILLPGRKGTHVELGIALGLKKRVFVLALEGETVEDCIFYRLATLVRSKEELFKKLDNEKYCPICGQSAEQ